MENKEKPKEEKLNIRGRISKQEQKSNEAYVKEQDAISSLETTGWKKGKKD